MTRVAIRTEYITLGAFLKFSGAVYSGGEAKDLIVDGLVTVNGERCTQRGKKLYGGETVAIGDASYEVVRE